MLAVCCRPLTVWSRNGKMAKLPRSGIAYQCLDERERSLADVVASLGLKPLSKKAERKIREELGLAIAKWEEPYPSIEVDDIVRSLTSHANNLDKLARIAAVAKEE
jgi:hypothetical protein